MNHKSCCCKCGTPVNRYALLRKLAGRELYECPHCGSLCSFCVEKHAHPVPVCKYCGAVVKVIALPISS